MLAPAAALVAIASAALSSLLLWRRCNDLQAQLWRLQDRLRRIESDRAQDVTRTY